MWRETGNTPRGEHVAVTSTLTASLPSWYRDGMKRKTTTVRMPEDLAETAEIIARGRGISVNALVVEALEAEIDRAKRDDEFMDQLRSLAERDKEILDRLAL